MTNLIQIKNRFHYLQMAKKNQNWIPQNFNQTPRKVMTALTQNRSKLVDHNKKIKQQSNINYLNLVKTLQTQDEFDIAMKQRQKSKIQKQKILSQDNKDERSKILMNEFMEQKGKEFRILSYQELQKLQERLRRQQLLQKQRFEQWKKNQQVSSFRQELQVRKNQAFESRLFSKFKDAKNFKIRRHSDIKQLQRRKQECLQQKKRMRNSIVQLHTMQSLKKKKVNKQKQKIFKQIINQKIICYQNEAQKAYRIISKLKHQEQQLIKKNQLAAQYFTHVLQDLGKLKSNL